MNDPHPTDPQVHRLATPAPVHLYVENGSGRVEVSATEAATTTTVRVTGARAADASVVHDADRVSVIAPKWRTGFFGGGQDLLVEVEVPAGSHLLAKAGSAGLAVSGRLAAIRVKSGSGQVALDAVDGSAVVDTGSGEVLVGSVGGDLRVRSGSGDVAVRTVAGAATLSSGTGRIRIGHAGGPVVVKTGSGDVEILEAEQDVSSTTGSGDVAIRSVRRGRIDARGASGDVLVGVTVGTSVWTDVSTIAGRVTSTLPSAGPPEPGAEHVELRATTVSGDIALVPA